MQNLEVYISTLLIVVAVATVLVNIIVEVLKKVTWDLIPTNLVSEVITLLAFFAICQIQGVPVVWYMVAAAVVLGLIVAYAAMFGFDKLQELIEQLGVIKDRKEQP